jgi:hypothetical protein
MLGLGSSLAKGGASLLTFVKDNLKLYLDFKSNKSDTLKFPSEGSTSFDGSNDYIDCGTGIGTSLGDNYAGSLTVSLWFKADVTNSNDGLFNIGSFSNTQGEFAITIESNILRFKLNEVSWHINHTSFTSTDWNHVACVYSAGNESNSKMYLNGVSVGSASGSFPSASDMDFSGLKTIIGAYYSSGYPFDGKIANVALWSRELSPEEIQSIMNKSYSQLKGVEKTPSLVAWWALDDTVSTEKITNGDFSAWTNDNPDGWTISTDLGGGAESDNVKITEDANGARIYSTGTNIHMTQNVMTIGATYEVTIVVHSVTTGDITTQNLSSNLSINSAGTHTVTTTATATGFRIKRNFPVDMVISSVSVKEVQSNDSKGSNNGTIIGATTTTSVYGGNAPILPRAVDVAKEGQADAIGDGSALFNGSTDHIVLGGSSPDSAFSISAWVFDTHASGSDFSAIYASNQTAIWFGVKNNSSGLVRFHINGNSNYVDTPSGSFSSPSNEWIHLACTWDGTNAKIYINGVSQTLSSYGTLATPTANANPEIGINDNNHSYNQWTGSISQVGIWRGALTQAQIQSVMESTSYSKIPADVKSTLGNNVVSYHSVDNVSNTFVNNIATYTTNGYIFFSSVAPVSTLFKLEYTVLTRTAPGLRLAGGSSAFGVVALDSSVGTHSYNLVSSSNSNANYLSFNSTGFRGTITDISVKQISNEIAAYYPLDGSSEVEGLSFAYADKVEFTRQTFTGAFSIMCWFNGDVNTDYKRLFGDSSPPSGTNDILVKDTNGQIAIRINGGYKANINSVPNNTWSHLAYTRDSSGNIKAYLNGVQSHTSTSTDTFTLDNIGGDGGGAVMKMSSASMYNVEKSADEVLSVYNEGIGGDESSNSGLQLYYKLDNASTVTDLSGNGNNGTVTGATLISAGTTDSVGNNDGGLY